MAAGRGFLFSQHGLPGNAVPPVTAQSPWREHTSKHGRLTGGMKAADSLGTWGEFLGLPHRLSCIPARALEASDPEQAQGEAPRTACGQRRVGQGKPFAGPRPASSLRELSCDGLSKALAF